MYTVIQCMLTAKIDNTNLVNQSDARVTLCLKHSILSSQQLFVLILILHKTDPIREQAQPFSLRWEVLIAIHMYAL